MEQILTDQVNNKLNKSQYTKLSTIMGSKAAQNKTKERQNENDQIFLNNLIKERKGKHILIFDTSEEHKGLELPRFNWAMANKLLPEKTGEQKKHNAMRNEAESIAVLQRIRTETHKHMMTCEQKLASERKKAECQLL